MKHATGPVAGYTLYRAQLQAKRAEYLPVAPLPPCKTQFSDYLFALECVWPAGADGEPRVGRWSGVIGAPASTECPLWDEGSAPAWGTANGLALCDLLRSQSQSFVCM